jgi:hypothetical protein
MLSSTSFYLSKASRNSSKKIGSVKSLEMKPDVSSSSTFYYKEKEK